MRAATAKKRGEPTMRSLKKSATYLSVVMPPQSWPYWLFVLPFRLKAQYGLSEYSLMLRIDVYNPDGTLSGSKIRFVGQRGNGDAATETRLRSIKPARTFRSRATWCT
jgi:hypothetical protein